MCRTGGRQRHDGIRPPSLNVTRGPLRITSTNSGCFECTDRIIYDSQSSILPPLFLRRFTRSRKFCEEIAEVDLTAKQVGKVRLPFYMFPDYPDHKNLELGEIFEAAIPQVAKILVDFDPGHPVIENFTKYFKSVKGVERCRRVSDWMRTFSLAPTPEMKAVLSSPLTSLLGDELLSDLLQPECQERVLGVGAVLLQLLAVQKELGEPLNLNGDILEDLITGRVAHRGTPLNAVNIPVTLTLKRKASEKIEGERREKKAKSSKKPGIATSKKRYGWSKLLMEPQPCEPYGRAQYGIEEPPRLPVVEMP
ncbi:hypothetical protein K438DRAFT_1766409 [Mycena galopus ATCC 62051]|nr:hypothetical protein K438DRAFT_1766409 [Mycena galopus ATCC 62051]